jgi:hypothetical protein
MSDARGQQLATVRALLDGRPVRWAPSRSGDYDGRERTLEVFNADAHEHLELIRRLRPIRAELAATAGGPVVFVFHTRKESARLYADFVEEALRSEVTADVETAELLPLDDAGSLATDVGLHPGARDLPRRAA